MPKLSQETIAVVAAAVALGTLILTTTSGLRDEIRAIRAETRTDREVLENRLERRIAADREASEKHLEAFERRMAADREATGKLLEASGKRLEASERHLEASERRLEAFERRMANFEKEIIRLTEQQGNLGGLVEGLRHRQLTATGSNDPPG